MIEGLKAAHDAGYTPTTVGIDTWAVDFLLLDADGTPIGDPVAYRDGRTAAMREELEPILPFTNFTPVPASSTSRSTRFTNCVP